jgi:MFS family permease
VSAPAHTPRGRGLAARLFAVRGLAARGVAARVVAAGRGGPLSVPGFRLLTAGQLTSTAGDYCYAVALPWLVLSSHGGAALLGIVLACYGVPRTVLIPVGGVLADKLGTRVVMLVADAGRCGLVAGLAALAAGHVTSLVLLGPLAALLGAGEGLFVPASFAIMPSLLEPGQLQAGNAINAAAVQAGTIVGPVLGGVLVALAGPAPAFAVDAASFAVSAVSLALIRSRAGAPPSPGEVLGAGETTAEGDVAAAGTVTGEVSTAPGQDADGAGIWPLLRRSRLFQVLVVLVIAANLGSGGTFDVALPALAHARFGAGGYGALMACLGAGALGGMLAAAAAGRAGRPALLACAIFAGDAVAVAFIPFLGGLAGAAAATLVFGACNGLGNVIMITLIQRWAPPRLLGRVMSVVMLCALGSFPLSVAVAGILVRHLGPTPFFPVAGGILALALIGAITQRELRDFGAASAPAGAPADNPAVAAG